jgi:branched-chain amino acid transport system permease protein
MSGYKVTNMPKVKRLLPPGVVLIAALVVPWVANQYVQQVCIIAITYAILGLAFSLTMRVGLPRFDLAAWWGIGAYATALLLKAGVPFLVTIIAGALISALLGWLFYVVAVPRGIMVFIMFSIVASMAIQLIFGTTSFFGGWGGSGLVPRPTIGSYAFGSKPGLYYLGIVLLLVNLAVYYLLYHSKVGRAWDAIGSSLKLAGSTGINVARYRMANIMLGNFFAAVSGSYFVAYSLVAVPTSFGFNTSVKIMLLVFLGGVTNSFAGPIVGALALTFIPEYFRMVKQYEPVITGVIIILIIIFLPGGIMGIFTKWIRPAAIRGTGWLGRNAANRLSGTLPRKRGG